jgi:oxygen-dependent protoporphyrinogen oxidase
MDSGNINKSSSALVIGGGIAGLMAAYTFYKSGIQVQVLEAETRVGGVIQTVRKDGFELDLGPNSLVLTPFLKDLISELGLGDVLVEAALVAKNRYLVKRRMLHALSPHPLKLLQSPYLSWGAKFRILTERIRPAAASDAEESILQFVTRRFGGEVAQALADPIFSGIYAGDIGQLSIAQVMPLLPKWEKEFGSITKGILNQKEAMKGSRKIVNFRGGLGTLTQALASPLEGHIHKDVSVNSIVRTDTGGYRVGYVSQDGLSQSTEAQILVYAAPLYATNSLDFFSKLSGSAARVHYSPVRTLHVAIPKDQATIPEGFGFLVPTREEMGLLGCIFSSSIFPDKAPEGWALLTLMLGGAHQADMLRADHTSLDQMALVDLKEILHISGSPRILLGTTWPKAIPQKNLGYEQVLQAMKAFEAAHPGFRFAGNAVGGVSVGDTMEYAAKVVHSMI